MTCANTPPIGKKINIRLNHVKDVYKAFSGRHFFFTQAVLRQLTSAKVNAQHMSAFGSAARVTSEASL